MPLGGSNEPTDDDLRDILKEGQKVLLQDLVDRVKSGKATHQEKAVLRNLLRDNGMFLLGPGEGDENKKPPPPASDLPDLPDPEDE